MLPFLRSGDQKSRDGRNGRNAPLSDFKIGPFKIASTSSSPRSECEYTALTSSTETAVDIPLSHLSSQRRDSSCSLDLHVGSISPPPGYNPPSYYSSLLGGTYRRAKGSSRRCKLVTIAAVVLPILYIFCYITFRPPNYIILPPETYVDTLKTALAQHIPNKQARDALADHIAHINQPSSRVDATKASSASVVPPTIWSSDGKPAPKSWYEKWSQMGFEPKFLDDAGAEDWVQTHYHNTSVKRAWDAMPRFILKADLLRYLLMLDDGGTWSDMDTVPLMHRANWTKDAVPLSALRPKSSGLFGRTTALPRGPASDVDDVAPEPVRAIIGIENDPNENVDPRNFFERWRLLPMRRHRPLQFVQWTLHAAPNHPIMLDVVRRILEANDVYSAYEIEQQRDAHADGWGWGDLHADAKAKQAHAREAHGVSPWNAVSMSWKWQAGHWRWGWDTLSVEEWTGPAVFTDAVVSYLYAVARVRPEDLSLLKQPVQIRDVVIVPSSGFNPGSHTKDGISRLVHLFRGSWKG